MASNRLDLNLLHVFDTIYNNTGALPLKGLQEPCKSRTWPRRFLFCRRCLLFDEVWIQRFNDIASLHLAISQLDQEVIEGMNFPSESLYKLPLRKLFLESAKAGPDFSEFCDQEFPPKRSAPASDRPRTENQNGSSAPRSLSGKKVSYRRIPIANTTTVLLGTGTSITQAAMRELAKAGVLVGFCGGGGTPLFSANEVDVEVATSTPPPRRTIDGARPAAATAMASSHVTSFSSPSFRTIGFFNRRLSFTYSNPNLP